MIQSVTLKNGSTIYMDKDMYEEQQIVVLRAMDQYVIEEYAIDYLDLIDPDDCDCHHDEVGIDDFEDYEVSDEYSRRFMRSGDIVFASLFNRIKNVANSLDNNKLSEAVDNLEYWASKLNEV